MQTFIQNPQDTLELSYIENDEVGIAGDKLLGYYDSENDIIDQIDQDIEKIISKLKDGEKIGYIYYSENTPLYNLISQKYKDKIGRTQY